MSAVLDYPPSQRPTAEQLAQRAGEIIDLIPEGPAREEAKKKIAALLRDVQEFGCREDTGFDRYGRRKLGWLLVRDL